MGRNRDQEKDEGHAGDEAAVEAARKAGTPVTGEPNPAAWSNDPETQETASAETPEFAAFSADADADEDAG